jgi:4-diphosphocytidyl-2-C-methyl-D-erythritol kinase
MGARRSKRRSRTGWRLAGGGDAALKISEAAPAKVDLFLHVTGRRADRVSSAGWPGRVAGMGDTVSACSGRILSLAIEGAEGAALDAEPDNLVLRAGAGLGGGSRA